MTFKVTVILIVWMSLIHRSRSGVISVNGPALADQHISLATSYMHFHGPVEGPGFEVKVPYTVQHGEHNHLYGHEDQAYNVDYVAHPKYEFSYGVEDHHTGDFHTQKESRDGNRVSGEYSVKEPSGSVRVVSYRADKDGFHAVVHTSGKNDHSGATYTGQGHVQLQGHDTIIQDHGLQEYATGEEY